MKWLSLVTKSIAALMLGLFITTIWFGNDERCAVLVHNTLQKTFKDQFGAHFRAQVKSYTFFPLAIELEDVSVRALNFDDDKPTWWWKARSMKLQFSPLSYLYSRSVDMYAFLQGVTSFSAVSKGYPLIADHIQSMVVGADVGMPITLQNMSLLDAQGDFVDVLAGVTTTAVLDSQVKRLSNGTSVRCLLKKGTVLVKNTVILDAVQAKVSATFDTNKSWTGSLEGSLRLPLLDPEDQEVTFHGSWQNNRGDIKCSNKKRSIFVSPVTLFIEKGVWYIEAQGTLPLYGLGRCITHDTRKSFEGALHLSLQGSLESCKGVLSIDQVGFQGLRLHRISGAFEYVANALHGTLDISHNQQQIHGDWHITDNFTQASCTVENTTDLFSGIFKYWHCTPHNARVQAVWQKEAGSFVDYFIRFDHQKIDSIIQSSGRMTVTNDLLTVKGSLATMQYLVEVKLDPLHFVSLSYHTAQQHPVGVIRYDQHTKKVTGSVTYDTISPFIKMLTGITLPGSGTLEYDGTWDYPALTGSLQFTKGVVRVSGWYNFISALKAHIAIDVQKSLVTGKNCFVQLHKGEMSSKQWSVKFDPWKGITWAHIPWQIKECFVNWKKDLYAVLSGSFIVQKQDGELPSLQGFLSLDRAQFRANILSSSIQRAVIPFHTHPFDMTFGVHVFSKQPVEVLASPLETKAALDIDCLGTLGDPTIQGRITFSEGIIHLPAHPLQLVRGSLTFSPQRMYDPVVELIAQNRIKKYLITLSVSGTAQDPHIALDASPPLSEQQILMLLLGGNEEESLTSMVPALLMRNIEGILFGSQRVGSARMLPAWLEPLRKVSFVPQFTDQSARGGFKGVIEIEVSKRLRALIEKNFSLTEDTAVKIDYLLSDDVSLRAVRDTRGDLGAAIEMRLKF